MNQSLEKIPEPDLKNGRYESSCSEGATFGKYLRMRMKEGGFPSVSSQEPPSITTPVDWKLINSPPQKPRATWIGHATVLVQANGISFLTDPILEQWAGPVDYISPPRIVAPSISFDQLPKIDFVVTSHNHYDHLDHRTVDRLKNSVTWFVPMGLKEWFVNRGVDSDKVVELHWWQSTHFKNAVVTLTPAVHWSKRTPRDTNKSLWGSWAVEIGGFKCWFGGDTAFDEKLFGSIGQFFGPFDLALIPIGAYEPRYFMGPQHIDPAQAVKVHKLIGSKRSMPIHWGTFQLTHEPYLEPIQLLKEAVTNEGVAPNTFKEVKIGETILIN